MTESQARPLHSLSLEAFNSIPVTPKSRFIIGQPVAYTNNPTLPNQYQQFSPRRENVSIIRDNRIIGSPPAPGYSESNSRVIIRSPPNAYTSTTTNFETKPVNRPPSNLIPPSPSESRQNVPINRSQSQSFYYSTQGNNSNFNFGNRLTHTRILTPQKQIIRPIANNNHPQLVPKHQVDHYRQSAHIWETKYIELSRKFEQNDIKNQSSSQGLSNNHQIQYLRKQNLQLKKKVRQMEARQDRILENWQEKLRTTIQRSKQSTLKQCMLLTDRYRLQSKISQKPSHSRANY